MNTRTEAIVLALGVVAMWCASHRSSAKCSGEEESGFELRLAEATEADWPSRATMEVYHGGLLVDAGKKGAFRGSD